MAWKSVQKKTKLMTNVYGTIPSGITVHGHELETVKQFKYLGATINDQGSKTEVLARAAQTTAALARLKPIWKDKCISLKLKIRLLRALVFSIFLYACETWTLTAYLERRIESLEMKCYRTILGISYTEHVKNVTVRDTIHMHIGPHEDLLTSVKQRKLKWYGHVTRSSGLAKTVLQGSVRGRRKKGRPKKRWCDNIREWTGKSFAETQALAHDREGWRRLAKKSSRWRPNDSRGS